MQNLIDFIVKYKHWFVFFLMEGFCLALLFRFNNYQGSVFFTTANSFVGGIYSAVDGVTSYVGLNAANRQLEAENASVGSVGKPTAEIAASREGMQLSFFQLDDPVLCQVRDEILGLDVNNLTPLEALNKLNDIKKIVSGK